MKELIDSKKEQTEDTQIEWFLQMMDVLSHLQRIKLFHNDIKPA